MYLQLHKWSTTENIKKTNERLEVPHFNSQMIKLFRNYKKSVEPYS